MSHTLINTTKTKVRFSEVDSMEIVWHGNYLKFLEDGREAFGHQYNLGYIDFRRNNFQTPIVKLDLNYKREVKYSDSVIIETKYVYTQAAKITFDYKIFRCSDSLLALTAKSIQVFTDLEGQLQLTNPEFYINWQKERGII